MSLSAMGMAISDEYDADALPGMRGDTFMFKVIRNLMAPLLILRCGWKLSGVPHANTVLQNNIPLTGRKKIAFVKNLDLVGMKKFCKSRKCTINDYATSLILTTFYEYTQKH